MVTPSDANPILKSDYLGPDQLGPDHESPEQAHAPKHAEGGARMIGAATSEGNGFEGGVSMGGDGIGSNVLDRAEASFEIGLLGVHPSQNGSASASISPSQTTSWTAAQLAERLGATLVGRGDLLIGRVGHVEESQSSTLAFFRDVIHARKWVASGCPVAIASASCVPPPEGRDDPNSPISYAPWDINTRALLVVPDADLALLEVLRLIESTRARPASGVHPTVVIHPMAKVSTTAAIGPGCVIGAGATIADGCVLLANVTIGPGAIIGPNCLFHPGVCVLDRCTIGARVILQANCTIGSDGFGYVATKRGLVKLPHVGTVEVGDDVEIGASSCVDRAKFGVTRIGAGTKIDNLCQIAHNCVIGRSCVLCGQVGLAGSVTLGDGVVLGGKVGIADGVSVGSGARIAGYAGVAADVPPGATYMGTPAGPASEWRRIYAAFKLLPKLSPLLKKFARDGS